MLLNLFQQQGNYHKLPEGTGNTQSQQRATTTTLLSWAMQAAALQHQPVMALFEHQHAGCTPESTSWKQRHG